MSLERTKRLLSICKRCKVFLRVLPTKYWFESCVPKVYTDRTRPDLILLGTRNAVPELVEIALAHELAHVLTWGRWAHLSEIRMEQNTWKYTLSLLEPLSIYNLEVAQYCINSFLFDPSWDDFISESSFFNWNINERRDTIGKD